MGKHQPFEKYPTKFNEAQVGQLTETTPDGFIMKPVIPRHKEARIVVSQEIRAKVRALAKKNNVSMATVVWLGMCSLEKFSSCSAKT